MGSNDPVVIDDIGHLIGELRHRGYRVVGPTLRDSAIVLDEIEQAADLPAGWGVDVGPGTYRLRARTDRAAFGHSAGPQSWKQFLHPQRQMVWSSDGDGEQTGQPDKPYAFLGVRGCDLAAMAVRAQALLRAGGSQEAQGLVDKLAASAYRHPRVLALLQARKPSSVTPPGS